MVKKKIQPKPAGDFGRQYRIGMKNRRKLGRQVRHYDQG